MSGERARILKMVADRIVSVSEAEELLEALKSSAGAGDDQKSSVFAKADKAPKYLFVKVTGNDNVDVRVPLGLLRAGMRFTSLIPPQAMRHIGDSLHEKGIEFDLNNIKPGDIEELIKNLTEMEVNVNAKSGENVRVFCA
jgi:hypothetical protein